METTTTTTTTCLEFYSGVGGLHYSLRKARKGEDVKVIEAFDVNDLANVVYEFNHGIKPTSRDIGSLEAKDLDGKADAWLLSPPCQPYTRQGLQRGSEDPRAQSFIKLLDKLGDLECKPSYLLIENVVGFEESETRNHLVDTMKRNNYTTQEFLVSPIDLGVPYSRARYFCLAKISPLKFLRGENDFKISKGPPEVGKVPQECRPLKEYLSEELVFENYSESSDLWAQCLVKSGVRKYLGAIDIVSPHSRRCCCFTKSYYKYYKGTGSLIAVNSVPLEDGQRSFVEEDGTVHIQFSTVSSSEMDNLEKVEDSLLDQLVLRYFTPREVANLHSFPSDFSFPEGITRKQRYSLLGNSLSVAVVAHLLEYLFQEGSG
ncbi:DNA (cytosine-5)-methyltransferase [Chloropicon primus]|uniref:DNA (Cytosine-5)-methyltransferase n=2 Tax=Chloropicon primus TaxID=1764295 RepID=A0A5B8MBR0_9CHLO|nr:DNA (cytosine-5)-methyltransferase [Chloropicon primus]UPQ97064.1 DNA (cytosine-5)-methyltransferase [Chloropicon primus]|eukprot:QDZ17848.1 DNA (cytosine-5)-methyltransferase [Chloropicon primus]